LTRQLLRSLTQLIRALSSFRVDFFIKNVLEKLSVCDDDDNVHMVEFEIEKFDKENTRLKCWNENFSQ
jgi:hypothetical protein